MFLLQPPEVRTLDVFTTLPARFRQRQRTVWSDANMGGREVDSFLEGPVFDGAGNLYVTDIPFGEPNGMKFLNATELLVTDYRNGLMVVDSRSGAVRPYLGRRNTESFKGLNDLTFDSQGNLYFTDQGQTGLHDPTGRVYRLSPSGRLDLLLNNVPSPNGIVLSPDEKFLFVAATRGNCVWRMPLLADGGVSKAGQFFTSYGPSGPDGLAMDSAGQLLVANPGLAYVWVLNHRAEPVQVLRGDTGTSLTNLAFGGTERKTLYCTESTSGTILYAHLDHAGLRVHRGSPGSAA
jgi:gluconolactonase